MSRLEFCHWLAQTRGSVALHESIWAYPIVESVHVLTLCLFLGLVVMLDLRLLGVIMRKTPVSEVSARLWPWTAAGFAIMVASGVLLFYAIPVKTYLNIFFRVKLCLLLMAGANAFTYHRTMERRMADWNCDAAPPLRARLAGGLSLIFWTGVVVCGRMIAYNWFDQT